VSVSGLWLNVFSGVQRPMEPRNRVKECPESTYAFYFIKIRPFEDPELREKLVLADHEFQKKVQARNKIIEAAKAKKVLLQILTQV
jgi:hypothetical protein